MDTMNQKPTAGLGLKPRHFEEALDCRAAGLWFEVHPENYVVDGGPRDLDGAQPPALQQEQLVEMAPLGNDVWSASFVPPAPGRYRYGALAWVDHFRSWRAELARRVDEQDIRIAARTGVSADSSTGHVGFRLVFDG